MNKKISLTLTGVSFACLFTAAASKFIYGSGLNNPLFILTGIQNYQLFIVGIETIVLAALVNHFTRSVFINALTSGGEQGHSWLYSDKLKDTRLFVLVNYVLFGFLSFYYFDRVTDAYLFLGVDGDYSVAINAQQTIWADSLISFGANFLQALGGNIWFPLNALNDFGYQVGNITGGFNYAAAHTGWAFLLFTSTLLLARAVKLNWGCGMLAAWIAPCLILFPSQFQFSKVPLLIPHLSTSISLTSLIVALAIINSRGIPGSVVRSAGIALIVIYFSSHTPGFLLLAFPLVALCGITKLFMLENRKSRLTETCVFAAPIIFMIAAGALEFIMGVFLDTAVMIFPQDFIVPIKKLNSVSSLFYRPLTALFVLIAFAGILGSIIVKKKPTELKILAIASGILCALIFIVGFIYIQNPQVWSGPAVNYFEFMLWPIYAIFIAYFLVRILSFLRLEKLPLPEGKMVFAARYLPYAIPIIPGIFFLLLGLDHPSERFWKFPPPNSPVMDRLMENSHRPGDPYKGRIATFTGLNIKKPVSWMNLQALDYGYLDKFDSDFRKAGLWINGIPTLTEYNPLITPRFHFFAKSIFGLEGDQQIRNMLTLRNISPVHLKLMGVNRLITDAKLEGHELLVREKSKGTTIRLYSLEEPNLGNYSPTEVILYENLASAMKLIKSQDFDPTRQVLVERPLGDLNLLPILSSRMIVGKNKYSVTAKSDGTSILLLPIEYSSCFEFKARSGGALVPAIFPGNLLFIAILFERDLDATLSYKNGPFANPDCRLIDYREFKALLPGSKAGKM